MDSTLKTATVSLIFNILYSAYHVAFGVITSSWWLLTVGVYYLVLSAVRFAVLIGQEHKSSLTKLTGGMLMVLSLPLAGTVILALIRDRGQKFHMIVMISIAVYAFTKITLATVKLVRSRRRRSEKTVALRNIAFADALVSIFSLQRSMLVSFDGMSEREILIMNGAPGISVCIIVFWLGFHLVRRKNALL